MKHLIEKLFKRQESSYNYIIGEYKPSHTKAMRKPARQSDYDIEPAAIKDEMQIDNIYQDS